MVTDLLLFAIAMIGSIAAAYFSLQQPEVGGLSGLIGHPALAGKLSLLPDFSDWAAVSTVLIVPLAVQWWSTWYPGAEPGGGGYVAQRMLAARNEKESMQATLWFNVAHYALRPWPWMIVALCSLIVYPSLESIQARFPELDPTIVRHDLAYPAMLAFLPQGLLGLAVASLAAAYMSTISTHLNWGASYVVDDFYRRFVAPQESERHYVTVGRLATVVLVVLASAVSLWLENALQAFQILLQIGAGTGLIFLLRWFWWRVNAWSEISGMVISFLVAVYFQFVHEALGLAPLNPSLMLVMGVAITTVGWVGVTMITPPVSPSVLQSFYDKIRPLGPGWAKVVQTARPDGQGRRREAAPAEEQAPPPYEGTGEGTAEESLTAAFLCWFFGCVAVYGALFGTGYVLYGRVAPALVCWMVFAAASFVLFRFLPRVGFGE